MVIIVSGQSTGEMSSFFSLEAFFYDIEESVTGINSKRMK